jgi:tryptophanyl-tRNA synthetase
MERKRVLSGMRPSGKLHLGHLHGALKNWVDLSAEYDCFFFSADWHALTSEYADTSRVHDDTIEMCADWIASGIDPEKSTVFIQSEVKEHAELFLILSMITPLPWAMKCPTFKEQQAQVADKDLNTFGFLGYPVLQAADILAYRAHFVPVGVDQIPHIELTRDIAKRSNNFFGEVFPLPEGKLTKIPKVPGNDGRKMSKSYGNDIKISDPPEVVEKILKTFMTDPARQRRTDPGNPDICPLFTFHQLYSDDEKIAWVREGCTTAGIGCLDCKKPVIEKVLAHLEPIRTKREELLGDKSALADILEQGSNKAREAAGATMDVLRKAIRL